MADKEAFDLRIKRAESNGDVNAVGKYIPGQGTAKGDMQVMDATNTDPGFGVRPAADGSVAERSRVGTDYANALLRTYGSEEDAAAAYNWGPGNFNKWRKAGGDPARMPEETRNYITKVTGSQPQAQREVTDKYALADAAMRSTLLAYKPMPSKADFMAEQDRLAGIEADRPNALERLGAAWEGSTDARIFKPLIDAVWGERYPAVAGYTPDPALIQGIGADSELLSDYFTATSPQAANRAVTEFKDEQARRKVVGDRGMLQGFAIGMVPELLSPTNIVTALVAPHVLAARGVGSIALAAKGASRGAVMGSAIVENMASGTAIEAVAQLMEGRFNVTDLAVSGAADLLLGGAAGALTHRATRIATAEGLINKAADTAMRQEAEAVGRAQAKLGPNATKEQIVEEVRLERTADANSVIRQSTIADAGLTTRAAPDGVSADAPSGSASDYGTPKPYGPVVATSTTKQALEGALTSPALTHEVTPDTRGARQLISHMLQILPPSVLEGKVDFMGYAARGRYTSGDHLVKNPGRGPGDLMPSAKGVANEAVVLAHEVVHQATVRMIAAVERGAAGVSVATVKAVQRLSAIHRDLEAELVKLGLRNKADNTGANYAVKNLQEFVAQAMTDTETKQMLLNMPAGSKIAQLWSKFADGVLWVLGINPKAKNTALQEAVTLIERVMREEPPAQPAGRTGTTSSAPAATVAASIHTDPDANRFGLGTAPVATKTERDDVKAMLALHKQAEKDAPDMTPEYRERVKNLADNSVFNVASTGLIMLKSESPLVRWVASQLLEDASGVQAQRGTTAAIKKHITYRAMLGNTVNDIEGAYAFWKVGKPGGFQDDMVGGKNRAAFDRVLAEEIEARAVTKAPVSKDPNVKAAVDSIEAAYTRTAKAQVNAKTLGSEGLHPDSIGYMPHKVSAGIFFNLTNEQKQVMHQALTDQFITIEGWDASFSDMLASKYMQRVRDRATGGNSSTLGGNSSSSIDLVEEALNNMQLPADQVAKHMASFKKGAANFTKARLNLDLNKVYPTAEGDFKLMDIFEANQIELLRGQVERASGDVALALKGVQGRPGLTLLRKAMQFGEDGKVATLRELDAFDQIAAELLGEPFGTATPKWMERAMSANTLVRLGGIVYNQIAESINAIVHVGAMGAMESVAGIPRLRKEIIALARGEKVDNPIIGSLELAGAEFGTDAYKIVMPFDNPSNTMPTYGQDTLTLTDRLLRGGGHLQAKLSGWRAIHSAQQRGMAEQITHKVLRYVREGKDDIALQQFGITPELRAAMRNELDTIARFEGDRLVEFDVTKMSDPAMREELIQAVWRGTAQIIQGAYIGERGKWAHDGTMKLLTQFRTFSITSMEKQWGRQRNSRGAAQAFGIVMGAMTLAAPIYMARTYASSVGRPDQEAYLEERLSAQHIARATMNYVAGSGMAGDFIDALSSTLPDDWGVKSTGGRAGVESEFVGNYVAPALSLVNDAWGYAQSPLELDEAAKVLPMRNLPFLLPLMNATRD